ncbi:hypothetical protein BO82DRAFT_294752 [Aspergillus uvarum CBS 121591]|uniref:Histidine-specific methyltransferase SAM-dependent domain-containing protein n=1 Tax=Aspergillus uvarum CBS 121591 TaxID=1448315 RepID=A0A319BTX1_9EURO|nr:hypothetical protein BO82DRAFT_294752 [Aspergillus uvarum CBS 121591]PYH77106.1 hypothetical protein BO82DRAFT_294752 [Aspergillus uvarum CBS 121591]
MANHHGTILDLRGQHDDPHVDLRPSIVRGLQQTQPELPSIVMWDEVGLNCYEELCHHPAYYLRRAEVEILSQHATSIAQTIPANAIVLELGCGSLTKTCLLLSALAAQDKPIAYYALDLVASTLEDSLQSLRTAFPAEGLVQVSGAVTFLTSCRRACSDVPCSFIVGVDGCRDEERLMAAYNMSQGPFHAFMCNGLAAVNRLPWGTVFEPGRWQVRGGFDPITKMMRFGHMTVQPVTVQLDGCSITFGQGTWIKQLVSGKWTTDDVREVAESAGFELSRCWADETGSYGE